MSEKPKDFLQLLEQGHDAAWQQNWQGAIAAYSRAIQMLPDDAEAHSNLGLALMNSGQLDKALRAYRKAMQLAPDDPAPLEGSAEALERLGQLREAAQQYVKSAEAYVARKDYLKAVDNWTHATELTPGLVSVHAKLAQAHEHLGQKKEAIRHFLRLGYEFRRMGDVEKAVKAIERALKLDKNDVRALNMLRALKSGAEIAPPEDMQDRSKKNVAATPADNPFGQPAEPDVEEVADPLGPIGEALSQAMVLLAAHVVEGGFGDGAALQAMGPALQGMEFQRQGLQKEAITAYQQAHNFGLRPPSLKMCLGGLQVLTDQPQEALKHLSEITNHPQLGSGAFHGIGQAYFKLKDQHNAAKNLLQSLQIVDTSRAEPSEIGELKALYERISVAMEGRNLETLTAINERFMGLLSGKDWKSRIAETRRHLEETMREGDQGMVDFLAAKGGDEIADLVSSIDRFIKQGFFTLAMDEAHRAIERAPFYLPVHVRMAEVMMKEGRIRQAINKYNMVAKSYLVREENDRAAAILQTVLDMAPLDVEVRMNLIHLLEGEERWDEALDQYIGLANTYQQLGDFERATQTYSAAERMAKRVNANSSKVIQIKHHQADINLMRLNTRQAQKTYEEILELDPQNEKALREIINIFYTQGNQVEAVKRLDVLLGIYASKGLVNKIRSLLEELVRSMPSDTALRARLASIYKKLNMTKEAIEQLDALGELQLDAGMNKEAANTIRQIIALKPDRVDEYKKLLAQLNG